MSYAYILRDNPFSSVASYRWKRVSFYPLPKRKPPAATGGGQPTYEGTVCMLATSSYHELTHDGDNQSQGLLPTFEISPQGNPAVVHAGVGEWFASVDIAEFGTFATLRPDAGWLDIDNGSFHLAAEMKPDASGYEAGSGQRACSIGTVAATSDGKGSNSGRGGARRFKTSFSKGSRRRLLRHFAKLDRRNYESDGIYFCTLTLPDVPASMEPAQWKRWLDSFLKRMRREYKYAAGAWRLEMVKRKSGTLAGEMVGHFHLAIFNVPASKRHLPPVQLLAEFRKLASKAWNEIVGGDEAHLKFGVQTEIKRGKRALRYMSKYVSKMPEDADASAVDIGRHWGIFNKAELPVSPVIRLWVHGFKNDAAMWLFRAIAGVPEDRAMRLPSISIMADLERLQRGFARLGITTIPDEVMRGV